jgi:predicted nucleic acid-binding protein
LALPITLYDDDALHGRAFDLGGQYKLPAACDAHYLALAERLSIDFFTGDRRLWNAVRHELPWVRLVPDDVTR